MAAGLYREGMDIEEAFSSIQLHVLDLHTGKYVEDVDSKTFDPIAAAYNPKFSEKIPPEKDLARIQKRSKYSLVYVLKNSSGKLDGVILPVYGLGLWGKMYGFISLAKDLNTVRGFAFYEHKETPGLGAEVDNPRWKKLWIGKKIYDESNQVRVEVIKGIVDNSSENAVHQVDGISGATITCRGVKNLLRYWLGKDAYGPYLNMLRSSATSRESG